MSAAQVVVLFVDDPASRAPMLARLRAGLQRVGWIEGRDVELDVRFAMGDAARLEAFAREAADARPLAIVAAGTLPAVAARGATSEVPIVMVGVGDPVARGLIASFERPGGNVTGSSDQASDALAQRVEVMEWLAGPLARVAVAGAARLADPPSWAAALAARGAALEFVDVPMGAGGFDDALARAPLERCDALFAIPSPASFGARHRIAAHCAARRVPLVFGWREFMDAPACAGCGPDLTRLYDDVAPLLVRLRAGESPCAIAAVRPRFGRWLRPAALRAIGRPVPPDRLPWDEVIDP